MCTESMFYVFIAVFTATMSFLLTYVLPKLLKR